MGYELFTTADLDHLEKLKDLDSGSSTSSSLFRQFVISSYLSPYLDQIIHIAPPPPYLLTYLSLLLTLLAYWIGSSSPLLVGICVFLTLCSNLINEVVVEIKYDRHIHGGITRHIRDSLTYGVVSVILCQLTEVPPSQYLDAVVMSQQIYFHNQVGEGGRLPSGPDLLFGFSLLCILAPQSVLLWLGSKLTANLTICCIGLTVYHFVKYVFLPSWPSIPPFYRQIQRIQCIYLLILALSPSTNLSLDIMTIILGLTMLNVDIILTKWTGRSEMNQWILPMVWVTTYYSVTPIPLGYFAVILSQLGRREISQGNLHDP
jgi:hypothetical protein